MKRIKLLSKNLINQIAAGEVIERPASAVKELVENSIDAGTTKIEVEISNGGRDFRVADNGGGIYKEDVPLAFSRHATSKLNNQEDLWTINTLGFRGEALASIISVAKVCCTTRTADSETGFKAECENSEIKITETGCAIGTTMEIKDLFYNVPARLKFLKQPQTELANITEVIQNIAIAHPEIAFNLINKKHSLIKTSGSADTSVVISEIYSKELIKELSTISFEDQQFNLSIEGFVSNPNLTRSNKKAIHVFVNSRIIKCPIISKAIDTAYKDLIPSGKYPFAVLNIKIPTQDIDINVHPSKKEIKYTKPNLIFNFVYTAVKTALEGKRPNLQLKPLGADVSYPGKELFSVYEPDNAENNKLKTEEEKNYETNAKFASFSRFADITADEIIEGEIPKTKYLPDFTQNKIAFDRHTEINPHYEYSKIIGQLNNTYILIETNEGLQIIDQHIAHERYLYERLKEQKSYASQLLLTSEAFEIDYEQATLIEQNMQALKAYGFEIEFISSENLNRKVKLKKIPQMLAGKNHEKIISDLMESISSNPQNIENEILERIACHASVKAGEKLNLRQIEELIENWQNTKFNKTCPHGRTISHTIPIGEIAKFFGRNL